MVKVCVLIHQKSLKALKQIQFEMVLEYIV